MAYAGAYIRATTYVLEYGHYGVKVTASITGRRRIYIAAENGHADINCHDEICPLPRPPPYVSPSP